MTHEHAPAVRAALKDAFRTLRGLGYFCRASFMCCQSCGCASVPKDKADSYVFYHAQDADNLREEGSCHLAWSGDGRIIAQALRGAGLVVEWDGSEDTRFHVSSPNAAPVLS